MLLPTELRMLFVAFATRVFDVVIARSLGKPDVSKPDRRVADFRTEVFLHPSTIKIASDESRSAER